MSDVTVWLIALAFYAPIHYLGPLLVGVITGTEDAAERKVLLRSVTIDCTLSMALAFSITLVTFRTHLQLAMGVLLLSMIVPYTHLALLRYRRRRG
jgi:hypothetical protein